MKFTSPIVVILLFIFYLGGAFAQDEEGSGSCTPECNERETCYNETCICMPGFKGDNCQAYCIATNVDAEVQVIRNDTECTGETMTITLYFPETEAGKYAASNQSCSGCTNDGIPLARFLCAYNDTSLMTTMEDFQITDCLQSLEEALEQASNNLKNDSTVTTNDVEDAIAILDNVNENPNKNETMVILDTLGQLVSLTASETIDSDVQDTVFDRRNDIVNILSDAIKNLDASDFLYDNGEVAAAAYNKSVASEFEKVGSGKWQQRNNAQRDGHDEEYVKFISGGDLVSFYSMSSTLFMNDDPSPETATTIASSSVIGFPDAHTDDNTEIKFLVIIDLTNYTYTCQSFADNSWTQVSETNTSVCAVTGSGPFAVWKTEVAIEEPQDDGGLSTGAIVGIAIAAVVVAVICIVLIVCLLKKKKSDTVRISSDNLEMQSSR